MQSGSPKVNLVGIHFTLLSRAIVIVRLLFAAQRSLEILNSLVCMQPGYNAHTFLSYAFKTPVTQLWCSISQWVPALVPLIR